MTIIVINIIMNRCMLRIDIAPSLGALYRDHRRQLDFLPAIASTSGRIHCELLRLLFLHAHRETTRFFEIFEDGHAQPHTPWSLGFNTAALLSLTLSRARQVSW